MSGDKKAIPSELDCVLAQMSLDLANAQRALEMLRHSGLIGDTDRGLVSKVTWAVSATQFNLARVSHLVNEPPEA